MLTHPPKQGILAQGSHPRPACLKDKTPRVLLICDCQADAETDIAIVRAGDAERATSGHNALAARVAGIRRS